MALSKDQIDHIQGGPYARLEVQKPPQPRAPETGEASGYGASRIDGVWRIYWMPGAVPLGVSAESDAAKDLIISALRTTLKEPKDGK